LVPVEEPRTTGTIQMRTASDPTTVAAALLTVQDRPMTDVIRHPKRCSRG
jgi:hypothetical protein